MPFKPGQSGNPRGRQAEDRKVKRLAREHTEKAIQQLVKWMDSDNPKASVSAACALLDRAYGKPKQTIDAQVVKRIVDESRIGALREQLRAASEKRTVQ